MVLPPSHEMDQASVLDALREVNRFIDLFPESTYQDKVKSFRRRILKRLVDHEVYVAKFYLDQSKPKAAIMRLEGAIAKYPDSGREVELLLTLGETHLQMGNPATAKSTFSQVIEEFGNDKRSKRATLYLGFIRDRYGESPRDKPLDDGEDAEGESGQGEDDTAMRWRGQTGRGSA